MGGTNNVTKRQFWSEAENDYLIRTHHRLSARQQAERMLRPYGSVVAQRGRLMRQGRIDSSTRSYHRVWTEREMDYLREWVGTLTTEQIAKNLNRSRNAVKIYAYRLGLNLREHKHHYTARGLGRIFGKCPKSIAWWIEMGWLQGTRWGRVGANEMWFVRRKDVLPFLHQYPFLVDRERVTHPGFKQVLDSEWRRDPWYRLVDVTRKCRCSDETLRREIQAGSVNAFRTNSGHTWGYVWLRQSDVEVFKEILNSNVHRVARVGVLT